MIWRIKYTIWWPFEFFQLTAVTCRLQNRNRLWYVCMYECVFKKHFFRVVLVFITDAFSFSGVALRQMQWAFVTYDWWLRCISSAPGLKAKIAFCYYSSWFYAKKLNNCGHLNYWVANTFKYRTFFKKHFLAENICVKLYIRS